MTRSLLVVAGIGQDGPAGLSPEAREHVETARVLAGGRRHLDFFPDWRGEKIVVGADVEGFVAAIEERYRQTKVVVLSSGDPLFFGVGRALLKAIPKDELLFLPHVSSVQLAFARIKETWDDARVVSLHGRPLETLIPAVEAREAKIAVLTDAKNHPGAIADLLRRRGAAEDYALWVCENLGGPDERISRHAPDRLGDELFSPLNVVVLLREVVARGDSSPLSFVGVKKESGKESPLAQTTPLLGIPEAAILHQSGPLGMITRREVRLLSLCYLELHAGDVVWDVGAGSGSVAVEAARLNSRLHVVAVERDRESFDRLVANVERFAAGRVRAVHAAAPEGLADLPDPDAVFVGGSGGRLVEILQSIAARLRPDGRIVVNCITLENFFRGWEGLLALGFQPEATSVQLSHSRPLGRFHSLEPENPIFILRARKP